MSDTDEVVRFVAYRGDGSAIYSGLIEDLDKLEWYRDGHPKVHRLVVERFHLVATEELPVDRTRARLETWAERNRRPKDHGWDPERDGPASDDAVEAKQ